MLGNVEKNNALFLQGKQKGSANLLEELFTQLLKILSGISSPEKINLLNLMHSVKEGRYISQDLIEYHYWEDSY